MANFFDSDFRSWSLSYTLSCSLSYFLFRWRAGSIIITWYATATAPATTCSIYLSTILPGHVVHFIYCTFISQTLLSPVSQTSHDCYSLAEASSSSSSSSLSLLPSPLSDLFAKYYTVGERDIKRTSALFYFMSKYIITLLPLLYCIVQTIYFWTASAESPLYRVVYLLLKKKNFAAISNL